jgi:uncharacterized phage protein (TIGR02220 family)
MAKRFSDTEKWKDTWFEELSGKAKLMYFFFLDNCDCAGIWKGSFRQFKFFTGFDYSKKSFLDDFGGRVVELGNGSFFMPGFVKFQYGPLKKNNNAHKGVIKSLKYNNIETSPFEGATVVHYSDTQDKDKDKDKDKEKEKKKSVNKQMIIETIDFLNEMTGKHFKYTSQETVKNINARIREGYTLEDFKHVIRVQTHDWAGTPRARYLRPKTLFSSSNFEGYLNTVDTFKKKEEIGNELLAMFKGSDVK